MESLGTTMFSDLSILWIGRYDYPAGRELGMHSHSGYHQLLYCVGGEAVVMHDQHDFPFHRHSMHLIQPGNQHGIRPIAHGTLETLDIKFIVNNEELAMKLTALPPVMEAPDDKFRNMLEKIRKVGDERNVEYMAMCQLLLGQLLLELMKLNANSSTEEREMPDNLYYPENISDISKKIIEYIAENYREKIKAQDFEHYMNLSYRYLSKLFINDLDMTPMDYLEYYRCSSAKKMLATSNLEIKQIAELIGYPNVHQFSRSFSRSMKIPPGAYRKSIRYGIKKDVSFNTDFVNGDNTFGL